MRSADVAAVAMAVVAATVALVSLGQVPCAVATPVRATAGARDDTAPRPKSGAKSLQHAWPVPYLQQPPTDASALRGGASSSGGDGGDGDGVGGVGGGGDGVLTLKLLRDAPAKTGATCLDGSPPGYWVRRANTSSTSSTAATGWIIHAEGGGWCWTQDECEGRAQGGLGSSKGWGQTATCYGACDGILSANATTNPDFYAWNAVFLGYCDGSSFSGDRGDPVPVKARATSQDGAPAALYYRGARILDALLGDLLANEGMDAATDVVFTGGSAGGLTTYLHCDHVAAMMPKGAKVRCLGDAGWFLDAPDVSGQPVIETEFRGAFELWNSSGHVHSDCIRAHTATNDTWRCIFAQYTWPYIRTPAFIAEGLYDSWQMNNILRLGCGGQWGHGLAKCSATQNASFHHYGEQIMRPSIEAAVASKPDSGAFASACIVHCQTIFNEGQDRWNWWQIDGQTPAQVFGDWYFGRTSPSGSYAYIDKVDWPANPSCPFWT